MDYGTSNANVINDSYYGRMRGKRRLFNVDRHLDYISRYNYDMVAVAAGQLQRHARAAPVIYVNSPGKGFNTMTVGAYYDNNTLGWSDDTMESWSQYNNSGRQKPEIAASGGGINSTTRTSPYFGDTGSGTSYATPMISAVAADMIDAQPSLFDRPESIQSILMATALHNIEGEARVSQKDGTGGMDASAALVAVERDAWTSQSIGSGTTFPLTIQGYAWKGDRVRFAMRWLSNPSGDLTSDPQTVDLDLAVYQPDNTTLVVVSAATTRNFEIVDFVAPVTGSYNFRIEFWSGTWSGDTWLGTGLWRDSWHTPVNYFATDVKAPPMGYHWAFGSGQRSVNYYWRALGLRSASGTDHDLTMTSNSWFDDPGLRTTRNVSTYVAGYTDFIMVDGNHWGPADEFFRTNLYSGSGNVYHYYANEGIGIIENGIYGPYTLGSAVLNVFDVGFSQNANRIVAVVPTGANTADLAVWLYKSDSASNATWSRAKAGYAAYSDTSSAPATVEKLQHRNTAVGDWLGMAVSNENGGNGQFYIYVEDLIFLPVIRR